MKQFRRRQVLRPESTLIYGEPVPRGDFWEGACLDDLLVTYKKTLEYDIPLDGSFVPPCTEASDPDHLRTLEAELAYQDAGLERAIKRSFRGETEFKAWGAEIDGVLGTAAAPIEVRQQVWLLIARVVQLGFASKKVLQQIVGYTSVAFQFRRELYALQHHLQKFIAEAPEEGWFHLPGGVRD